MAEETPQAASAPSLDPDVVEATAAKIDAVKAAAPGEEAVATALDGAVPVVAPPAEKKAPSGDGKKKPSRGKGVARIIEAMEKTGAYLTDDGPTTYHYDEERGAWVPLSEQALLALAFQQDLRSSAAKRTAIVKQLQAKTYVRRLQWGRVAEYEIPCANGVVDVVTGERRPHRAEDRLERALPVAWLPEAEAKCPTWHKALATWFPPEKDGGRAGALQEFFGYICLAHAKYKRALVLFGESDTGKSVPAMVAKAMVGDEFACRISVEDMDDPVRLALIKGKALNIITEVSAEALIADGGFKTLVSTEEPIMLDGKWKQPETYVSAAKHVIVTNNLPRLNDHTAATFNRLFIIPFDVILTAADQDRDLLAQLKRELPGILRWAAEGAARLVKRGGQWPDIEASRSIMTSYRDEMNPMRQFMRERMTALKDGMTALAEIARSYNQWNMGARNTGVKGIGKLLRAAGYGSAIKVAKYNGQAITCLLGFRLMPAVTSTMMAGATTGTVDESGVEIIEAKDTTAAAAKAMDMNEEEGPEDLS